MDEDNNSLYSLECLENCMMTPCPHIVNEDIEDTYPEISKMIKFFKRSQTTNIQKKYAMFKMMTPEERFMQFASSEPELMKRVPQNILASYINITPETFSRFKKRLVQ